MQQIIMDAFLQKNLGGTIFLAKINYIFWHFLSEIACKTSYTFTQKLVSGIRSN